MLTVQQDFEILQFTMEKGLRFLELLAQQVLQNITPHNRNFDLENDSLQILIETLHGRGQLEQRQQLRAFHHDLHSQQSLSPQNRSIRTLSTIMSQITHGLLFQQIWVEFTKS